MDSAVPTAFPTQETQGIELLALYNITKLIGNAVDLDTTFDRILEILNDKWRACLEDLVGYTFVGPVDAAHLLFRRKPV